MSSILDDQRLTYTYKTGAGALTVLKEISFTLPQGSTCAILGPSGSGKTTLLGLCAGLDRPTSGSVLLNGDPLADMNEDERARVRNLHVGFVFQNFQLIPTLTALENVTVPMELRGDRSARQLGLDLLGRVGLAERVDHYPAQLSGGEQQRVALARAFINRPKILFADEPTGNLDAETSAGIIEIMFDLNRSAGTALVLVTHDQEVATLTERTIRRRTAEGGAGFSPNEWCRCGRSAAHSVRREGGRSHEDRRRRVPDRRCAEEDARRSIGRRFARAAGLHPAARARHDQSAQARQRGAL